MCEGEQWELLKLAYARELARRKREESLAQGTQPTPAESPPKPAPSPKDQEPVPA